MDHLPPSFKKLLDEAKGMEQFGRVASLLDPVLRIVGVDVPAIKDALEQVPALAAKARDLADTLDRFNRAFASRGWIAYGSLNMDVAASAVAIAETGDLDAAEQKLVDNYSQETLEFQLRQMTAVDVFRPRMTLARLALTDYVEGRYHACVPVVLALLDGMVNDLGPRGFFAEGVNLKAWDSIAAHSTALAELAALFGARRTTLNTDLVSVPYRHGILHGMDVNYANRLVAAKTWAALFATREWALKAQRNELDEPPPKLRTGWRELFEQLRENADNQRRLDEWVARSLTVGSDIPSSGGPDEYGEVTPERAVVEFLTAWRSRNYGAMAGLLSAMRKRGESVGKLAGSMRRAYEGRLLQTYQLLTVDDRAAGMTVVTVRTSYVEDADSKAEVTDFRLVYEDAEGNPVIRGKAGGGWKVATHLE